MPVIPVEFEIVDAFSLSNLEIARQTFQRVVVNAAAVVYRLSDSLLGEFGKIRIRKVSAASCALEYFISPRMTDEEAWRFLTEFYIDCRLEYLKQCLAVDPTRDPEQVVFESRSSANFDLRRKFPDLHLSADILEMASAGPNGGKGAAAIRAVQQYFFEKRRARMNELALRHYLALFAEHAPAQPVDREPAPPVRQMPALAGRRGGPIPTDPERIRQILNAWEREQGKISQEAFCARHGVAPSTLRMWMRKRRAGA